MEMNKRLIENKVDRQRVLREISDNIKKRKDYEDDLKAGFPDEWKNKFIREWNKTTSELKGV